MVTLYNVKEVSKILKVTPHTVRNFITNHQLKATNIGNGYKIREDDLDDFIKQKYLFKYE